MMQSDRKDLIRKYKETPRLAGIYRVRNTAAGKSLIGSTPDVPGMLNRQRFTLEHGSHQDKELQRDWNELGAQAFAFETLDQLEPKDEPDYDPRADLRVLHQMWLDRLAAAGEALYAQSRRVT